jgi:hypothetical protein
MLPNRSDSTSSKTGVLRQPTFFFSRLIVWYVVTPPVISHEILVQQTRLVRRVLHSNIQSIHRLRLEEMRMRRFYRSCPTCRRRLRLIGTSSGSAKKYVISQVDDEKAQ